MVPVKAGKIISILTITQSKFVRSTFSKRDRVIDTKQQLTEIERNFLWKNIPAKSNKQTIITAQAEALEQVQLEVRIIRDDLKSTREKPDVIIPYKVSETIADEKSLLNSFMKTLEELRSRSLYDQLYGREKHHIN